MELTEKDLRHHYESLWDAEKPLKDYFDRKKDNIVGSEVAFKGIIAHCQLIGLHHLVVITRIKKTFTRDKLPFFSLFLKYFLIYSISFT